MEVKEVKKPEIPDAMAKEGQALVDPLSQELGSVFLGIDWQEYFKEFCKVHGAPIVYKGNLLFPDGWMYGMEYQGPEIAPPEYPAVKAALIADYWKLRIDELESTRKELNAKILSLEEIQRQRSVSLITTSMFLTEDKDKVKHWQMRKGPLDLTGMKSRLKHLDDMLRIANEKIQELSTVEQRNREGNNA